MYCRHISCFIVIRRIPYFPFSALTLLIGRQEGHSACRKPGVGLLVVTFWLELCTSWSFSCYHHLHHLSSNKIQNEDILVPANPGPPGKCPLKRGDVFQMLERIYEINWTWQKARHRFARIKKNRAGSMDQIAHAALTSLANGTNDGTKNDLTESRKLTKV